MNPTPFPSQKLWIVDVIALGLCLIITLGVAMGIVKPMLSKRAAQTQQREQLANEEQKCSRLSAAVLSMRKRTNTLQHELDTGAVQLDPANEINQKIAQLTTLLGDCDLELEDIQTLTPMPHRRCDLVPIRIVGLGGYTESSRFLEQLHQNLPDVAICHFKLAGAPAVAATPGQFAFDLCWFAAPSGGQNIN